jgi:integrase
VGLREGEERRLRTMHALRHSLAKVMHRPGVAPVDAAAALGHTLEIHLNRYLPSDAREAQGAQRALGLALQA